MNQPIDPPTAAPPGRRRLLYAGVAGAAAAAGAGLAWWRAGEAPAPSPDGLDAFWPLSFDTPAGAPLAMQSFRGRPLLINFWATWCPPCVEELPLIDGFYRQNSSKSWQVLGLAIDQPSSVRSFLQKTPVTFPIALAGLGGTELGKSLGNLTGGLPFTVLVSASGAVLHRRMGRVSPADLQQWAALS
ncbi:MAG: TlpA family protein disulfide reductase [Burkholderiales bacterium]|nr:TlpA family protein disulfide reductase [Burkholderiales bacterium]